MYLKCTFSVEVQRICQYCEQEFTARTTVTKYCSHKCSQRAYKARKRAETIKQSNTETTRIKSQPIEQLKAKEFLTVREVAQLLNCSVRSAYYYPLELCYYNHIDYSHNMRWKYLPNLDLTYWTRVPQVIFY